MPSREATHAQPPTGLTARQRIVAGARRHFFAHGFRGVTVDDLAAELGMSKKTLYAHFPASRASSRPRSSRSSRELSARIRRHLCQARSPISSKALRRMLACSSATPRKSQPPFVRDMRRDSPELFKLVESRQQRDDPASLRQVVRRGSPGTDDPQGRSDRSFSIEILLAAIQAVMNPPQARRARRSPPRPASRAIISVLLEGVLTDHREGEAMTVSIIRSDRILAIASAVAAGCTKPDPEPRTGIRRGRVRLRRLAVRRTLETLVRRARRQVKAGDPLFALEAEPEKAARDEAERRVAAGPRRPGRREEGTAAHGDRVARGPTAAGASRAGRARRANWSRAERSSAWAPGPRTMSIRARATRDQDRYAVAQFEADLKTAPLGAREDQIAAAEANLHALEARAGKGGMGPRAEAQLAPQAGLISTRSTAKANGSPRASPVVVLLPPQNIKVRLSCPNRASARSASAITVARRRRRRARAVRGQGQLHLAAGGIHAAGHLQPREPRQTRLHDRDASSTPPIAAKLHPGQPVDVEFSDSDAMTDELAIDVRGMTKRFGDRTVVDHIDLQVRARRDLRLPRPQRQRQDDLHPHALRPAARRRRQRHLPRLRRHHRERGDQAPGRLHDAEVQLLRGPEHRGEPRFRRAHVRRAKPPRRRCARASSDSAWPAARRNSPGSSPAAGSSGSRWPRA